MTERTAMRLEHCHERLKRHADVLPAPGPHELLLEVLACGVCRTDLHIMDCEVPARLPIVPGHEIVGRILATGAQVRGLAPGQRVGVPWLGGTCGVCRFCRSGHENLCDAPVFTGCDRDGGYASHVLADHRFCLPIPARYGDVEAAPLLCAGLIGWRALHMAGEAQALGLYGFGAAAHIIAQLAVAQGRRVHAFTRPWDVPTQEFARRLGCAWAGGSDEPPPEPLDAALVFAPDGALVPRALRGLAKGGRVVCAGIHMTDIPAFPYAALWGERSIVSVANLTRRDGDSFMQAIEQYPVKIVTEAHDLLDAQAALDRLRSGAVQGAAVLVPNLKSGLKSGLKRRGKTR